MTVHFEELWEEAEKITESLPSLAREQIIIEIKRLLEEYLASSKDDDPVFFDFAKAKSFGRILFALAYLARSDGINVYTALSDAMNLAKLAIINVPVD